jgi:hypothetical protein
VSGLGGAVVGRISQTAVYAFKDHFLNCIAHLRFESQATFSGNCCRRGGLSHYWPAVYPGGDIPFSNFALPACWALNTSAAAIQNMRIDYRRADIAVPERFLYGPDDVLTSTIRTFD